jgi:hypothetical protein
LSREFAQKTQADPQLFGSLSLGSRLKSHEFPVPSLFIREFDAETGSIQTAPSAKQSDMFPYVMEKRQNPHVRRESRAAVEAETPTVTHNADFPRFVSVAIEFGATSKFMSGFGF